MGESKNQKKAIFYALIAVLFWSTVPTAFKLGLRHQDNYQMLTGAALVSTVVLGISLLIQGKFQLISRLTGKDFTRAALLGLLNPAIYYLILFKAYDLLPAQVAQPLNMIWPIVLVLISIPLLKQKISWLSILSMIISFSGVAVLSFQGGTLFHDSTKLSGVLLALSTAVLWAFYWILNMKSKYDEVLGLFIIFAFATIFLFIGGLFKTPFLPHGLKAWSAAIYIGIFEMGLAFVIWLKALQLSHSTAKISNFIFIAPFLNLVIVHFILGESIYISTIFGIILVLTGIIVQNLSKTKHVSN